MIWVRPYDDLAALAVLQRLDPSDHLEAEMSRGAPATPLALWADWRAMQGICARSHVAFTSPARGSRPFAVFAVLRVGAGLGEAALLARDHAAFRRPLSELAVAIRAGLPPWAAEAGLHRISARSWAGHPTAAGLLTALGFDHECDMPGFGASGTVTFRQFAWIAPACRPPHGTRI